MLSEFVYDICPWVYGVTIKNWLTSLYMFVQNMIRLSVPECVR